MPRVNPRTRTGCLPCRQRKKKCDEAKPRCRACTRNKLQCAWPPHIIRIFGLDTGQAQDLDNLLAQEELESPAEVQSRVNTPLPIPCAASATKDISWSLESRGLLSGTRAGMLMPESPMLLSHYLEDTAPKLAPAPDIPWVSWILPVAYYDDLLMNAILALSGGHLLYKLPNNQEIRHATHRHYSSTVQTLYQAFDDERDS